MTLYLNLREKLKDKLTSKELDVLPRSCNVLGKIMLIKFHRKLYKKRKIIGEELLKMFPYLHTICLEKSISGVKRKPKIEVIAGCKSMETVHKEHGKQFMLDVSKVMWSKGNKAERARMIKLVKPGETVVDMFAGIGYWSIFIAEKAKKVYSIDINPVSVEYLRKNTFLNKVSGKIEILQGDCRKFAPMLEGVADRIIVGYIYDTEKFLPAALKMAKKHCVIHFHKNVTERDIEKVKKKLEKHGSVTFRKIKSYSPKVWHVVYDIRV